MESRESLMVGGPGPLGAIVGGIAALKLTVAPTQNFRAVVTIKNTGTVSASFDVVVILIGPYNMQKFSTAVSLTPGSQGLVYADFLLAAQGLSSWPVGTYDATISLWANAAAQVHAVTEAGALQVEAAPVVSIPPPIDIEDLKPLVADVAPVRVVSVYGGGDLNYPPGSQWASVDIGGTGYGGSWGGWDTNVNYSSTVAYMKQQILLNPADSTLAVLIGQLAIMRRLRLPGTS